MKKSNKYKLVQRNAINKNEGSTHDKETTLGSQEGNFYEEPFHRFGYICTETCKYYFFLTNKSQLPAKTITAFYKEHWQNNLLRGIKQNLAIKSFPETSISSVLTQTWIAMCAYLLIAYLKFSSRIGIALCEMMRPPFSEPEACMIYLSRKTPLIRANADNRPRHENAKQQWCNI